MRASFPRADRFLLLSWRKLLVIATAWVASVVLHNAASPLAEQFGGTDEPVFFLLAVIFIPAYFLIALVYTLIRKLAG